MVQSHCRTVHLMAKKYKYANRRVAMHQIGIESNYPNMFIYHTMV
jgi:hypothetical protein